MSFPGLLFALFNGTTFACRRVLCLLLGLIITDLYAGTGIPDKITYIEYQRDPVFQEKFQKADSVSAYRELARMFEEAKRLNNQELDAWFRLYRLKYYAKGGQRSPMLFRSQIGEFIREMDERGFPRLAAEALLIRCHHSFHVDQEFTEAFILFRELYSRVSAMSMEEFPLKRQCLYEYGLSFYYFDDHLHARKYFFEALDQEDNEPSWIRYHIYTAMGLSYRKTEQYDSSDYFFDRARKAGIALNDSIFVAIALGNKGHNCFLQGEYDKAIPLLELDARFSSNRHEWGNAAAALLSLARIRFNRNDLPQAEAACIRALHYLRKAYRKEEYMHFTTAYTLLARINAVKQNKSLAYAYADSALSNEEALMRRMNTRFLLKARLEIEAEQIAEAERKRKEQVFIRNAVITILFLLLLIIVLYFRQKRYKYRQRQLLAEARQKLTEEELLSATGQLNAFTQSMFEKTRLIEQLQEELNMQDEDALGRLQQHKILTNADWEKFRELFDRVHKGYLKRLKEKHPELSPAEIRFVALTRLSFSPKQMADTLGIGAEAVRVTRHRLRKKLNMNDSDTLDDLIAGI